MPADTTTAAAAADSGAADEQQGVDPGLATKIRIGKTVIEFKPPRSPSRCFSVAALLSTDGMAARGAALGLSWPNRKLGVDLRSHNHDLREYGHAVNDAIVALYGWSVPRVRAVGSMALAHVLEQVPTEDEVDEAVGFFEVLEEAKHE